jgi:hypothetical protein
MNDDVFLDRLKIKIEKMTGRPVDLIVDYDVDDRLMVDLENEIPKVTLGSAVLQYPGFARMCLEYVIASISKGRAVDTLEFHVILGRN